MFQVETFGKPQLDLCIKTNIQLYVGVLSRELSNIRLHDIILSTSILSLKVDHNFNKINTVAIFSIDNIESRQ